MPDEVELLDAVFPRKEEGTDASRQVTARRRQRAFVVEVGYAEDGKAQDIPLLANGEQTAGLMLEYFLTLDHRSRYLAVEQSSFTLRSGRHPVVRLDFRNDVHTTPAAHWNIHAERAAVTRMLTRNDPDSSGELANVHIPVGVARMRPCLEDVLESSRSTSSSTSTTGGPPSFPLAASAGAACRSRLSYAMSPRKPLGC